MHLFIGIFIGFILPFQTSMNTRLSKAANSALVSTFYAFLIGVIPGSIVTLLSGASLGMGLDFFLTNWFWVLGGSLLGVLYISGNILSLSKIGITQTSILPLIGQIVTSMVIDQFGFLYATQVNITLGKVVGILVLIAGIVGVIMANKSEGKSEGKLLPYQLLAVGVGVVLTFQNTINAHFGQLLESSTKATLYNFIIGAVVLFVICLLAKQKILIPKAVIKTSPWWMWAGAFIGVTYVLGTIFITPVIGNSMVMIATLLGLTMGSLLLSQYGLLGNQVKKINKSQLLYLLVAIVGVVITQLF